MACPNKPGSRRLSISHLLIALAVATTLTGGAGAWLVHSLVPVEPSVRAIAAHVDRDPVEVAAAWKLPVATTFRQRIDWQSNESVCGPAAVANTLRSLGATATSESVVLDGTGFCRVGFCFDGLTLDELAQVVRKNLRRDHTNRTVTVLRDLTADQFREILRGSNDPGRRIIINFLRAKIFDVGPGHFSPIGGYIEARDQVFILDVGEAFGPHLIARERLYAAMDTWDGLKKRGLLVIE